MTEVNDCRLVALPSDITKARISSPLWVVVSGAELMLREAVDWWVITCLSTVTGAAAAAADGEATAGETGSASTRQLAAVMTATRRKRADVPLGLLFVPVCRGVISGLSWQGCSSADDSKKGSRGKEKLLSSDRRGPHRRRSSMPTHEERKARVTLAHVFTPRVWLRCHWEDVGCDENGDEPVRQRR